MSKLKLAVIFGGMSSEHEVSRMSVTTILNNLDRERYDPYVIGITKKGKWMLYQGDTSKIIDGSWESDKENCPAVISPDTETHGLIVKKNDKTEIINIDVIFPLLHGKYGEDGTIQGLFMLSGIPYVGCDTLSSAVCMDKAVTHTLLAAANIEQAHYLWFYAHRFEAAADVIKTKIEARLNFPIFIKPANAGSSVGVSRVDKVEDIDAAVIKAAKEDSKIIVEEGIIGREIECAVMGNRDARASVVGEIVSGGEFYDYDDKYINGVSKQLVPAEIDEEISNKIRETAVRAYRLLGCSGLARVDFFVKDDGTVVLNELNTMPGFTSISMYTMLWQQMGKSYSEILDDLIGYALSKN